MTVAARLHEGGRRPVRAGAALIPPEGTHLVQGIQAPRRKLKPMNEQSLGETILEIVTMVVLALVVALMVMAASNVHFVVPDAPSKDKAVITETEQPPKDDGPKHPDEGPSP